MERDLAEGKSNTWSADLLILLFGDDKPTNCRMIRCRLLHSQPLFARWWFSRVCIEDSKQS